MKIAYSGIEGAFAHIAAKRIFPAEELISYGDFRSAYEAVEKGEAQAKQAAATGESRAVVLANLGKQYESEGDIDKAIYYFSQSVAERVELLHPYKRLAVLHRKRHEYADELRACTAAIQMLEWQEPYNAAAVAEFEKRIAYDKEKLSTGEVKQGI